MGIRMLQFYDAEHYCKCHFHRDMEYDTLSVYCFFVQAEMDGHSYYIVSD